MKLFEGRDRGPRPPHRPAFGAAELLKYVGPGFLVTVGFIDPGNWASNLAAGSTYGLQILWVTTLSTLFLIALQHNAAHLGIATGLCLSEAARAHLPRPLSAFVLGSATLAAAATAMAEILGAAIALEIITGLPLRIGAVLAAIAVYALIATNGYRRLEKIIIGFVGLIGIAFVFELFLVKTPWGEAARSMVVPSIPPGSMPLLMAVLGAVVMPHNLFLHSEVIQSRQWNLEDERIIKRQLDYEFVDTLVSMLVGWAINSAMIILAAGAFHARGEVVGDMGQAARLLEPLLGKGASAVFALALLAAGLASSMTAGQAGGTIFAGIFKEPYDIKDRHSRTGVLLTYGLALGAVMLVGDPFRGLVVSQMLLSIQLPITILTQIRLTSSRAVMGKWANGPGTRIVLGIIAAIVIALNILLLVNP